MDWALVLASQGIEASIAHDAEGWGLLVAAANHAAAQESIRLYRLENRHWHWRQPLVWRGVILDWRILLWALLVAAVFILTQSRQDLFRAACMDNTAVRAGEWWRIFSALLLHADLAHLALNVTLGIVLLGLAMGRYGAGLGLFCAYLAGAGGNIAGLFIYLPSHLSVGASGMVLGGLGLLAAQTLKVDRQNPVARTRMWKGVIAGTLLFVLFGLSPEKNVDIVAHLGGFASGFLLGAILVHLPVRWQNPKIDLIAGILLIGFVTLTTWFAFR